MEPSILLRGFLGDDASKLVPSSGVEIREYCCCAVDVKSEVSAMIDRKKRVFAQLRDRFKSCEKQDASPVELRLIERSWKPILKQLDLLYDFSALEKAAGWTLVEQYDDTNSSPELYQLVLYVRDRNISGSNRVTFERWKVVAELAGNELARYSSVIEDGLFIGACRAGFGG